MSGTTPRPPLVHHNTDNPYLSHRSIAGLPIQDGSYVSRISRAGPDRPLLPPTARRLPDRPDLPSIRTHCAEIIPRSGSGSDLDTTVSRLQAGGSRSS